LHLYQRPLLRCNLKGSKRTFELEGEKPTG
jgi:hypothetical protein